MGLLLLVAFDFQITKAVILANILRWPRATWHSALLAGPT